MREILFRGKTLTDKWVEGVYYKQEEFYGDKEDAHIIITSKETLDNDFALESHIVIPETVGQYTNLTDKNGNKIFENDICCFREWNNGDMCWIGKVHYEHQQFVISGDKNKECETPFTLVMSRFIPENIEIIGNIHDNPELLNGGEPNGK